MTTQKISNQPGKKGLLRAAQLMVLCLLAHATTTFGLSFNIPLASLTNNNTSGCPNYSPSFGGLVDKNFGPTSVVDTSLDTIDINSNLVDKSLNPVTPGHVSHVDVHTLIPRRPDLRWFANGCCWWGEGPSHHVDNGTTNTTPAYAAAMVNDMASRGFNGMIFSWYGIGDQTDVVAKNVKQYLATNTVVTNFTFTIMIVCGFFKGEVDNGNVNANSNDFVNSIRYCQTNYFNATNKFGQATYEKDHGHPLLMFFNALTGTVFTNNLQGTIAGIKNATDTNTDWVNENTTDITQSWCNMSYLWTQDHNGSDTNWGAAGPYNLINVTNGSFQTIKAHPDKQGYGCMCARFNGTLTASVGWSLGKYLPSGNGLCEYYRAQVINTAIPTNMTRMQWATWSDYEEGTEVELGVENYFVVTNKVNATVLSWTNTSGDVRTVDHYEVYASTDGVNAALLCSIPAASGIYQTNLSQSGLTPGAYQLYVDAVGLPCIRDHLSAAVAYTQPQNLPAPWNDQDIGSVGVAGSANYTNGTFTVRGSGADIWGTSDSFHFVYQPWTGDGQIVAHVASLQDTASSAKAGLMYRETLDDGSAEGNLSITPSNGVALQGRTVTDGPTTNFSAANSIGTPCWLMLKRLNNYLYGYESPDGTNWTAVGTNLYTMTSTIYVGLCVTSKSNSVLNTSIFDNVTVGGVSYPYTASWPNPAGIVYGTALSAVQNDATASVGGTFVYTPANGAILPAGTNVLSVVFTPTDTHYAVTNLTATLVVTRAPLTVTANAQSKVYGTTQSSPVTGSTAFTSSGLKNGETIGSVTLTYGAGGLLANSPAGSTSTITPGAATGGTFNAANYSITYVAGTLTVTTTPLTITANDQSKLYGTTLTLGAGQTAFTSAGLVLGETVGSVTLSSSGAVNTAPTGSYAIVPSAATGGTFSAANYNITYNNGTLTVFQSTALPEPWTNQDIGTVGVAGSASYSNGVFIVSGSGVDIWSTSDSFQMVYQPWTGDGQIVAHVTSMQNTASSAKAGLMFRETLDPASAEGDLFVTPGTGVSMQSRTSTGASATNVQTLAGITTPCWLALVRQGNYLYGYESADATNWTSIGTNLYSMTNTIYVGLCVTAKSNSVLNTCTFDHVSVDGVWLSQDIGSVGVPGSSQINYSNGVFTVSGSGTDIWGSSDAFQYFYQGSSGDSVIIAQVTGVQPTDPWSKAGVMIRESLAANARDSILFLSPSNGVQLQGRTTTGGSTVSVVDVTNNVPVRPWIQLVRSSQNINAYMSPDGINWSWIGTQTNPVSTSSYYIGLAVTSKSNAVLNTSTYDNVSVQNAWAGSDIGNVGVPGYTSIDSSSGTNSVFTVAGSGKDIWSTNDALQFVGQPLYGNGQIVARVLSVQNTDPWAKAGVMVRNSQDANAVNALLFLAAANTNGVSFQGRSVTGGTTATFPGGIAASAPYWLKLSRSGGTLAAYQSSNGSSWTQVGTNQTIIMSTNALIGLAVGSKTNGLLNTSMFDNVTITPAP